MPLCGNEKALERAGFPIARSTQCTMFHRTAEQLRPIYDEIRRVVRAGRYVHADETTQRVLDNEHCLKGWMWVMLSQQAIAYHYSDHRNSDTARTLFGDTTGALTIDGYSAYTCLGEKDAKRERSGCWGHYLESGYLESTTGQRYLAFEREMFLRITLALQRREECQQVCGRSPAHRRLAVEAGAVPEGLKRFAFHLEIGCDVAARRGDARVAEVVTDYADVDARLQQGDSAAVAQVARTRADTTCRWFQTDMAIQAAKSGPRRSLREALAVCADKVVVVGLCSKPHECAASPIVPSQLAR